MPETFRCYQCATTMPADEVVVELGIGPRCISKQLCALRRQPRADTIANAMGHIIEECAPDMNGNYDYERQLWNVEQIARGALSSSHVYVPYQPVEDDRLSEIQQAEPESKLFNECIECGDKATHLEARCTSHRVGATRGVISRTQFAEIAKFAANKAYPIRDDYTTSITLDRIRQDSFCQGALWARDQKNHVTKFEYRVFQDGEYVIAQGSKDYCIGYAEAMESMNWKHLTTVRGKAYRYEVRCDDVVVWSNDSKFTDPV